MKGLNSWRHCVPVRRCFGSAAHRQLMKSMGFAIAIAISLPRTKQKWNSAP